MTISYTLDVSQTTVRSFLRLLFRWRGSVWKAVVPQLVIWTIAYLGISCVYRFALTSKQQDWFASLVHYLNDDLSKYIPLSFLLGFFVSQVVGRWQHIINGVGWIDTTAVNFANLIRGQDEETRVLRRTLIRYMVLNQALVLRDISMQMRKRFPTLETLVAGVSLIFLGLITTSELSELQQIHDGYTRYWVPISWCYALLYKAREDNKIASDHVMEFIMKEIQHFRQGLSTLLKYDWIPIPLVYPQVVFMAVRVYFFICLISRQHIVHGTHAEHGVDPWVPVKTLVEFFVFMGWMKVAEALLNPLGEDDDDIEVNYVLDQNLVTGFALVDQGSKPAPELTPDKFYEAEGLAPLYSLDAAKRTVYPLLGSASRVNLVKNKSSITMIPHKSKLGLMPEEIQQSNIRVVSVEDHNLRHAAESEQLRHADPDETLARIRKRTKHANGAVHTVNMPDSARSQPVTTAEWSKANAPTFAPTWTRKSFANGGDHPVVAHESPRVEPREHPIPVQSPRTNGSAGSRRGAEELEPEPPRDYSPYDGTQPNSRSHLTDRYRRF